MRITADPDFAKFMVHKLIQNAIVFCPTDREIRIELDYEDEFVSFFVDDDGPGFQELTTKEALYRDHQRGAFLSERLGEGGRHLALPPHRRRGGSAPWCAARFGSDLGLAQQRCCAAEPTSTAAP